MHSTYLKSPASAQIRPFTFSLLSCTHSTISNSIPKPPLQPSRLLDTDSLHPRRHLQLFHIPLRQGGPVVVHAREPPILSLQQHAQREGAGRREDLQADAHAQGGAVEGRVLGLVGEGGPDGGGVADRVDEGEGGGAFGGGTGDGGGDPCFCFCL